MGAPPSGAFNIITSDYLDPLDPNLYTAYRDAHCVGDNFYPTTPCLQDGGPHYYYVGNLGPQMRTAVSGTMNGSYGTVFPVAARDVGTLESTTDLGYWYNTQIAGLPSGDAGVYECQSWVGGSNPPKCIHAHVIFNSKMGTTWNYVPAQLQMVACHETGHSFGLVHPDDIDAPNRTDWYGCMTTPVSGYYPLGSHNANHI
ncbi:MAG TPA: hypothetical protein VGO60_06125 [Iamia sp.]|nr:hypothetical protein [Iamia sp.]